MVKEDFLIFVNPPTLTTSNLVIREIRKSDLDDIFEYKSDATVTEHLLYYPHKSKADTRGYINNVISKYREGKMFDFAVALKDNNKVIGTVGFTSINLNDNSAEIGYVFNKAYWGRGYATEAVKELIDFGFRVLSLDKLYANILVENTKSIKLIRGCGFSLFGQVQRAIRVKGAYRDMAIYSLDKNKYMQGLL